MKLAEIAPELVVKLFLVCSIPHTSVQLMNGDKECKTAADAGEVPDIAQFYELIKTKNWQAIEGIYQQYFFSGLDISKEDSEASAKLATEQRNYLECIEANLNSDIDISKVKAEVHKLIDRE